MLAHLLGIVILLGGVELGTGGNTQLGPDRLGISHTTLLTLAHSELLGNIALVAPGQS